jgi:DNA-binding transcriptional MerR regulator
MAQKPHQHNELAAKLIRELRGYGVPIKGISRHLEWLQEQGILDLGGQGYARETLKRHYRLSLDVGALPTKHMLMQVIAQGALGEDLPEGISPDLAYREGLANARWYLEKVHGVGAAKAAPEGRGQIPIDLVREVLTVDEIDQLERIMGKLQRAMDPSRAIVDATAL